MRFNFANRKIDDLVRINENVANKTRESKINATRSSKYVTISNDTLRKIYENKMQYIENNGYEFEVIQSKTYFYVYSVKIN